MKTSGGTDKVVIRYLDGRVLKGALQEFDATSETLTLREDASGKIITVSCVELKAVFFVRSFEGDSGYRESKSYASTKKKGQKIFIKFKDGENIVGFLEGSVPWEKGFFLNRGDQGTKGFYILPVDAQSNNIKMFVLGSAVQAVTVVP